MNACPAESAELILELPARPGSVATARHALRDLAEQAGVSAPDVQLAVSEAVSNAVAHAFRERPAGTVRISARIDDEALRVSIADDGSGMRPNLGSTGLGLGMMLITRLASHASFDSTETGTTVSMSFTIAGETV